MLIPVLSLSPFLVLNLLLLLLSFFLFLSKAFIPMCFSLCLIGHFLVAFLIFKSLMIFYLFPTLFLSHSLSHNSNPALTFHFFRMRPRVNPHTDSKGFLTADLK